ncbi:MAG: NUDIX domain-containing protein [Alphaproteobacteria bacterium]|nr:NUDIX domain-containing protein [Alphaproteobacteria bacterium]
MDSDIHPNIAPWLARHPPVPLSAAGAADYGTRAALLPFARRGEVREYLVMRPAAKRPELGPPPFQIAKGKRMAWMNGRWADAKTPPADAEIEELPMAALREGREELGVLPEHIAAWYDCGGFPFASARTGATKRMRVYAAAVGSREEILAHAPAANTTAARQWMTLPEFTQSGRADHAAIVAEIETLLKTAT